jgi:tetratricopeptide (TPR) repeat protein
MALDFRHRLELLHARYGSKSAPARAEPSPEVIEQLKSLGYLAGTESRASTFDSGVDPKDRISDYERYGRAIAAANAGHLNESNAALEELLDKDPGLVDVRVSLGLNQQKLGAHTEAAESFKAVLKQSPTSVIAHFDLAVSEHALGKREEAVKELEATLALAPYYTRGEEMLASVYLERKDYQRARTHLNHLIQVDPASYIANYNLGALDCIEGKWQEGYRHLHIAIEADPSSAEAHNTLGSLDLRRGDLESAAAEFDKSIRLNPRFASPHYNLGMILRQQDRKDEAAREFQEALSADPQFRPAREALDQLKLPTRQNQ